MTCVSATFDSVRDRPMWACPGNPAVVVLLAKAFRPEALRPHLSMGLPMGAFLKVRSAPINFHTVLVATGVPAFLSPCWRMSCCECERKFRSALVILYVSLGRQGDQDVRPG